MPLFEAAGEYHLLFTKRTERLNHHRGEISFPGGAADPGDPDLLHTALRESWEEVGIPPDAVELLGVLDDRYSVYNYLVTPYVGFIPGDLPLKPNAREIDKILKVPVSHLRRPEIFRAEEWRWRDGIHPVYFYRFGNDEIWGLTAAIVRQFLHIAFGDEPPAGAF